jgi:hypothetical protein
MGACMPPLVSSHCSPLMIYPKKRAQSFTVKKYFSKVLTQSPYKMQHPYQSRHAEKSQHVDDVLFQVGTFGTFSRFQFYFALLFYVMPYGPGKCYYTHIRSLLQWMIWSCSDVSLESISRLM